MRPGDLAPGTRGRLGHLSLISGSEISRHERQHCAAIDAAKGAGLAKRIAVMLAEVSTI